MAEKGGGGGCPVKIIIPFLRGTVMVLNGDTLDQITIACFHFYFHASQKYSMRHKTKKWMDNC